MRSIIITLFTLLILTTACRNKDLIRPGDPLNVAYDKSLALFEGKKYDDAAYGFDFLLLEWEGALIFLKMLNFF